MHASPHAILVLLAAVALVGLWRAGRLGKLLAAMTGRAKVAP